MLLLVCMGNTVGSRGVLTHRQKEIIIGTLLGDACLEKHGKHTRIRVDHYEKHKKYVFWLAKELLPFSFMPRLIHERDKRSGKVYSRWHFSTASLSLFDEIHELFYIGRKKIVPSNIISYLTPLSLAVWYMDDGFKRRDCKGFYLCTSAFSDEEQMLIQKALQIRFQLVTNVHHQRQYVRIYISSAYADLFNALIKPFIHPVFQYKLL